MPKPFFTPEEHLEPIENLLKHGLSYRQIAEQYSCDHHTVRHFVRKNLPEWYERRAGQHTRPTHGLRILVIDIETRPGKTYFWHTSEKFIRPEYVIEDTTTYCFAAKWLGEDTVEFWADYRQGHAAMVERAHELFTEADGIVTYNGARFDIPHLNLEFLRSGMRPPAPAKSVDLLQTVRKQFRFTNNRLTRVSKSLGIGEKLEHEGFIPLVEKCEAGDRAAQQRMQDYNAGDVKLTEDLYYWLLPWIEGHPSHAVYHLDERCPNCGSEEFTQHGYYPTKTGQYPRYQCDGERCGKWFRGSRRSFHTEITETAYR